MDIRCACGCGIPLDFSRGRTIKRFAHGHNARGRKAGPMAEATKRKISATKGGWTDDELAVLRASYPKLFIDELEAILPRHSRQAIYVKAQRLGFSKAGDPTLPGPEKIRRALTGRLTKERNPNYRGGPDAGRRRAYERARAGRWLNDPVYRERQRLYRERNIEKVRATMRAVEARRRARKLAAFVGPISYDTIVARDGTVCGICGREVGAAEMSFDHIVPLSKGGAHSEANLRVAHLLCNVRRGNRD